MAGENTDAFVQVAPDGTGKKIRNVQIDVVLSDGSISTVEMQVINIADKYGNAVDFTAGATILRQMVVELRAIRQILQASSPVLIQVDEASPSDIF